MTSRVIGIYNGDLDKLMFDVFKYEKIIETWKKNYPDSDALLLIEIDGNDLYTLTLNAESNRKNSR